ncbi:zinc finger BED domain-containing protein 4-like [Salmo salar]|uniref:Zinc finger BED domain-containing protein 4-like n=1 Tax=Salmo salar TaxID=8030 RepID=A0ABM3F360_SALSA|nr:zinc finger BED domain-containing protein 4-like [Salmo salar]
MKMLKWTHHPCLAHTINLIVRDALKVMKPAVDKVKAAVEYFHRSTVGAEKLKSTQRQMRMTELRPKQDCTVEFNIYMLKRFLESKDAIISTLTIVNAPVDALTQEEWEVVEEVCRVLEPFEQVTVEISGESYVSSLKNDTPV